MEDVKSEVDASTENTNQTDEDKKGESANSQNGDSGEAIKLDEARGADAPEDTSASEDVRQATGSASESQQDVNCVSSEKSDQQDEENQPNNNRKQCEELRDEVDGGQNFQSTSFNKEENITDPPGEVEVQPKPKAAKPPAKDSASIVVKADDLQGMKPPPAGKRPKHCLEQVKKLYNADQTQYIKRRAVVNSVGGNLPYSGKFQDGGVQWKLHGDSGLLTSTNRYVALVSIEPLDELDRATTFNDAKMVVLKRLKVVRVLVDEHMQEVENAKQSFEEFLKSAFGNTIGDLQNAEDLFQLERILMAGNSDCKRVVAAIRKNAFMSVRAKHVICEYIEMEVKDAARSTVFTKIRSFFGGTRNCVDVLKKSVLEAIQHHNAKAMEMTPAILKIQLQKVSPKNSLFITKQDVKLFSDLLNTMDETVLKAMFPVMMTRYSSTITNFRTRALKHVLPITNHIFYYLCRSLLDIHEEIESKALCKDLMQYTDNGWQQIGTVKWSSPPSILDRCLEKQLPLMIKLVNHYEVGRSSATQRFPYEFKLFANIESDPKYQQVIEQADKAFGRHRNRNLTVLPDELHVWICLLDDTIAQLFANEQHIVNMCLTLLKLYLNYSLSSQMSVDSLETLRVITHNTIRFVAQAGPFVNPKNEQDNEIMLKQINYMNRASLEGKMSFVDYRDMIEVFAQYWKQRSDAIDDLAVKLPGEHLKRDVEEFQSLLLRCMAGALDKSVELTELVNFYREYEELLYDLHKLPMDWFVRLPSEEYTDIFIKKETLQVVENKWMDSEKQCYRVKDFEQFGKLYLVLFDQLKLPLHFIVETIKELLKCIVSLEMKECWSNDKPLAESEQLNAAGLLIASVRSSLLYLKEQPDYISFEQFLQESVKPFATVSKESSSFADFEKRVLLIKESFWYIRNLNAIDLTTALKLYKDSNTSNYHENLPLCYQNYSRKFEEFMGISNELSPSTRIEQIVKETLGIAGPFPSSDWLDEFKLSNLPTILAGLSAAWALHVSQDVASTGQYLKPHCIQVLCVLRLLSADQQVRGVRKHLAQVLTGQGKSLVLALVASVLALCGHSVQIMCYSKYLATRDGKDFEEFYEIFGIRSKITYQTFEEAAGETFDRIAENAKNYVQSCIGLGKEQSSVAINRPNPVLLIDEVDVLFDEKLYGDTNNIANLPRIPGLDKIQLLIWKLVQSNRSDVRNAVDNFINNDKDVQVVEFKKLMQKSEQYRILKGTYDRNVVEHHTNTTLFSSHINDMISTAQSVHAMKLNDSFLRKFRLNTAGNIVTKKMFGNYSEFVYYDYYNTFIYFRLKQTNYEQAKFNYGYLVTSLGSTSYAKIPEGFPLILGVSGTLTTLRAYEKKVVKNHYNITEMSVMPSFFGGSNLKFNETQDFKCLNTVNEWMNAIFSRINSVITAKRSVLVVFDTDTTIDAFKRQFAAQLDRLNVLTVDTSPANKERFINDAGVARTITLATREMGRGVDYKSSVAVESAGGVHVIQSFFSVDVKEEAQIKGRTARKDNRGSYELIVCIKDLREQTLVQSGKSCSTVSYSRLSASRLRVMTAKDATRDEKLRKANEMHDVTVDFYRAI